MRTTVDIDDGLLERAKRLALKEKQTLAGVVTEALAAYLSSRKSAEKDPPFELIVRGTPGDRFPSPTELRAIEEDDELLALGISESRRHATS